MMRLKTRLNRTESISDGSIAFKITNSHLSQLIQDKYFQANHTKNPHESIFIQLPNNLYIKEPRQDGGGDFVFVRLTSDVFFQFKNNGVEEDAISERDNNLLNIQSDHFNHGLQEMPDLFKVESHADDTYRNDDKTMVKQDYGDVFCESSESSNLTDKYKGDKLEYTCLICSASLESSDGLKNHCREVHSDEKVFNCDQCGKLSFGYPPFVRHSRRLTDKSRHNCDQCNKSLKNQQTLVTSKASDKPKERKPCKMYTCPICNEQVKTRALLRDHYTKGHPDVAPFKCSECGKSFKHNSGLVRHYRLHLATAKVTCHICSKVFLRKQALLDHVATKHSGVRPHQCDICNKAFAIISALKTHKNTIHSDRRDFVCDTCGSAFTCKSRLAIHQRKHTGLRPFICETCHKGFQTIGSLNLHLKIHAGDKQFCCSVCGKMFVQNGQLKAHEGTHHGLKRFACKMCDKTYTNVVSLRTHERRHSGEMPFKCIECDRNFISKAGLRHHMQTHSGLKPYVCRVCQMAFSQSQGLRKHTLRHHTAPTRLFTCTECGQGFVTTNSLSEHFSRYHITSLTRDLKVENDA